MPSKKSQSTTLLAAAGGARVGVQSKSGSLKSATEKRKFHEIRQRPVSSAGGWKILNGDALFPNSAKVFTPPSGQRGFETYPVTPIFLLDPRHGRAIKDIEAIHSYWFISDRTKQIFEAVDPQAFVYLDCITKLRDGSDGPRYWLCDVVRVLDAIDEKNSRISSFKANGTMVRLLAGARPISIREEIVQSSHISALNTAKRWCSVMML